jgi:hypothetical protein
MRKVHAVSGPFVLVFFSLLLCCTHFVPFSGVNSVFTFLLKVDSRCTTQGIPDLHQLTAWSSERNPVEVEESLYRFHRPDMLMM